MREIKLRAWDKSENVMLDDVYTFDIKWDTLNDFFKDKDDLIFLQYTGLKDKNGREIYEGDLIRVFDPYMNYPANGVAKVVFSHAYVGGWLAEADGKQMNIGTRTEFIEVIGSVHENPELLAGDNK